MSTFSSPPLQLSVEQNSKSAPLTRFPDEALANIKQLYRQGLYLQAYDLAQTYGPLKTWSGVARIEAGRLAGQLGAQKLRRALHILAWRQNRTNADCFYHYVSTLWECQGLFAAWKCLNQAPKFPDATPQEQGNLLSLWSSIYSSLRDFDQATQKIDQATQLIPDDPWVCLGSGWFARVY